ncbi:MAG: hypothetical protein FJ291_06375 [Planctomycetes bacterium]|nr:hypothetical protein [Planctomycetota bacterium]
MQVTRSLCLLLLPLTIPWSGLLAGDAAEQPQYVQTLGESEIDPGNPPTSLIANFQMGYVTGVRTEGPAKVYFGFRPSVGKMVVVLELPGLGAASQAELALALPGGKLAKGVVTSFRAGRGGALLHDVGVLPEGDHLLTGALLDAQGRATAAIKSTFRRIPLPWLNSKVGIPDTPPPPFTPVTLTDQTVTAIGRTYTIGQDGNFRSLTVLGEEILASPIRFEAEAGGATTAIAGTKTVFGKCAPTGVRWESEAAGSGLLIRSSVAFEFDGMARYDIAVKPSAEPVKLSRLSLVIPLKEKYGLLFHALPVTGKFREYVTAKMLDEKDGVLWDSKTWSETAEGVARRPLGNFVSMLWLGGHIRGLAWFAESERGWVPDNGKACQVITRGTGVVELAIHFVASPFTLSEPRKITYGFLATPPKPLPPDYRLWDRGRTETVGPVGGRLTSCEAFAPWKTQIKDQANGKVECFNYWPANSDWGLVRKAAEIQRGLNEPKYHKGTALMLYHDRNRLPIRPAERPYYEWVWRCGSYPPDLVDTLAWHMDKWIENGIDGIYIDDVFPQQDCNGGPVGTAYWLAPDGATTFSLEEGPEAYGRFKALEKDGKTAQKVYGANYFQYREYMKRLYTLFVQHGKRPIITTHDTSTLVWPWHSFVTVVFDCEESGRFTEATTTYMDAWPLERFMAIDNPERSGIVTIPMLKGAYMARMSPAQRYATERSAWAVWLLFDHNVPMAGRDTKKSRLFSALDGYYYGSDVQVFPFWRNEDVVKVEARVEPPLKEYDLPKQWKAKFWTAEQCKRVSEKPLYVTLYKKGNRCLVVAANFLKKAVDGKVTLALHKLGVPTTSADSLKVEDLDDWGPPRDAPEPKSSSPDSLDDVTPPKSVEPGAPERPLKREGNTLSFRVSGQDFRAIELSW